MRFVNPDSLLGICLGILGGVSKFLADIPQETISQSERFLDAGIIALLSAVCGLFGKDLYQWIKKRIKNQKDI